MKKIFWVSKRNVGWLEDGVFRKVVQGSKHLFKKGDSWGIDYDVLKALPDDGEIRIKDSETEIVYIVTVRDMRRWGAVLRFKSNKGDWGAQVFLPRERWDIIKDGVRTNSEITAGQNEMWDIFETLPSISQAKKLLTS